MLNKKLHTWFTPDTTANSKAFFTLDQKAQEDLAAAQMDVDTPNVRLSG